MNFIAAWMLFFQISLLPDFNADDMALSVGFEQVSLHTYRILTLACPTASSQSVLNCRAPDNYSFCGATLLEQRGDILRDSAAQLELELENRLPATHAY